MSESHIILDFGTFELQARLFDSPVAQALKTKLPLSVSLTRWGDEYYGPINLDLGRDHPVPAIPPGGLAYSQNGGYLCVFFGQTPAWPVDHIGQIHSDTWLALCSDNSLKHLTIKPINPDSL